MDWIEYARLKQICDKCINEKCQYCHIQNQLESFEKEEDYVNRSRCKENEESYEG